MRLLIGSGQDIQGTHRTSPRRLCTIMSDSAEISDQKKFLIKIRHSCAGGAYTYCPFVAFCRSCSKVRPRDKVTRSHAQDAATRRAAAPRGLRAIAVARPGSAMRWMRMPARAID